jgi:hypothetical protein
MIRCQSERSMLEEAALRFGSVFYADLSSREQEIQRQSLSLLEREQNYFNAAAVLQSAAFSFSADQFPFDNPKTFAAIALGFSLFDHLRRGWLDLLSGYYLPAMTIARYVFEAALFETAIGVGLAADYRQGSTRNSVIDDWLSKWWRDELRPGTIAKLIKHVGNEIQNRSTNSQITWAKRQNDLWNILAGWAHANWVPVAMSGRRVAFDDKNPDIPALSFGGQLWNPDFCKLLGNLYAALAVDSTFALRLALLPQLHQHIELRLDNLLNEWDHWKGCLNDRMSTPPGTE